METERKKRLVGALGFLDIDIALLNREARVII